MEQTAIKNILEAAVLASSSPLSFDKLVELFTVKGVDADRGEIRTALAALADDYADRAIELKETASGYRVQVKSSAREWLHPLFEERAPRYTRALLETLALIAYRQPITRAEIEEVRGVAVSSNIVRTLMERGWVRVVGFRDVPGKPSMLGTTREFLDYFGLRKLDDLPPLADIRELGPISDPQGDFVDALAAVIEGAPVAEVSFEVEELDETSGTESNDGPATAEENVAIEEADLSDKPAATEEPSGSEEQASIEDSESPEEQRANVIPIQQSEA